MNEIIIFIIGYFLGSILRPLNNFLYSESNEKCEYHTPNKKDLSIPYESHDILVTKYLNKTTHINCHWWKTRTTFKTEDMIYIFCPYGYMSTEIKPKPMNICYFVDIKHMKPTLFFKHLPKLPGRIF